MTMREDFAQWFESTRGNPPDADNLITQFMEEAYQAGQQSLMARLPVAALEHAIVLIHKNSDDWIAGHNNPRCDGAIAENNGHIAALTQLLEQKNG
jgi:hypothetical protein